MKDFKVEFEFRNYTMFLESSNATPETLDVKVIMYNTVYHIYKDKATNTWHNHISNFQLGKGLLQAVGDTLDDFLK